MITKIKRHEELTRTYHWLLIFTFTGIYISGYGLTSNSERIAGLVGGFPLLSKFHILLGLGLMGLTAVYILLRFERYCQFIDNISTFSRDDIKWIIGLFSRHNWKALPPQGKYNMGQKLFCWALIFGVMAMCISGTMLTIYKTAFLPKLIVFWQQVHQLTAIMILTLIAGHVFFTVFFPYSRGMLAAMLIDGNYSERRARVKNSKWLEKLMNP